MVFSGRAIYVARSAKERRILSVMVQLYRCSSCASLVLVVQSPHSITVRRYASPEKLSQNLGFSNEKE